MSTTSATTSHRVASSFKWQHNPRLVPLIVIAIWSCWLLLFFARHRDIRDPATIGLTPLTQSHISAVIRVDPSYHYYPGGVGYDGQYSYFLALDPAHAYAYMDAPNYRYSRILYPLLACLLAWGQTTAIPYTLLLINLLALIGGTYIAARWLKRVGKSPWLGLLFGLCPGLVAAAQHDLNEPLAYMLAVLGLSLLNVAVPNTKPHWVLAGIAFAAAGLTRETTLLIPVLCTLHVILHRGERRGAILMLALACTPFLLYKIFLTIWLGAGSILAEQLPTYFPFGGILYWWPFQGAQIMAIPCVILPALVAGATVLRTIRKDALALVLVVHVLAWVIFLPAYSYMDIISATRVTAAIPIVTLFCLPEIDRVTHGNRTWLLLSAGLWLALLPWLFITF